VNFFHDTSPVKLIKGSQQMPKHLTRLPSSPEEIRDLLITSLRRLDIDTYYPVSGRFSELIFHLYKRFQGVYSIWRGFISNQVAVGWDRPVLCPRFIRASISIEQW